MIPVTSPANIRASTRTPDAVNGLPLVRTEDAFPPAGGNGSWMVTGAQMSFPTSWKKRWSSPSQGNCPLASGPVQQKPAEQLDEKPALVLTNGPPTHCQKPRFSSSNRLPAVVSPTMVEPVEPPPTFLTETMVLKTSRAPM